MAIKDVVFEGVVLWANLPPREPQINYKKTAKNYGVTIECSKEQYKELKKEGIASGTKLKDFEDFVDKDGNALDVPNAKGKSFITLRSKNNPTPEDVAVADEDGNLLDVSIANGSTAKVNALLIDVNNEHCKKVLRLQSVVITNLIEYEDNGGGNTTAAKLAKLGVKYKPTVNEVAAYAVENMENTDDSFLGG